VTGRRLAGPSGWYAAALYVSLVALFAAGIWGSYRAAFPAKHQYRATGIFEARVGDTTFLVRHEAVPGLMEEMKSMLFSVASPEMLDRAGLRPGDRIRFTLEDAPARLVVVDLQRLP